MRDRTIRIGIVGAGRNTVAKHIPLLQTIEGVELVSVCNRSRESSERVAAQFGIPNIYNHWQPLVKSSESDAIVIGTWPYLHAPVTLAALAAGKHVLCEARMAMNLEEARAMLKAATERPRQVAQLVPAPFTLALDATIKHLENQDYLGRILAIDVRHAAGTFLDANAPMTWRQDRELSGMNVLALGIWYETIMRWIGEATRVSALGQVYVAQRRDALTGAMRRVELPDHLDVTAEMACGAQAHFQMSAVAGLTPRNEATLWGSHGTLRVENGRLLGGVLGDGELRELDVPSDPSGGWHVEEEFIAAIRGERFVERTTFEAGVKYMAFTEAVNRSLETGRAVDVEET